MSGYVREARMADAFDLASRLRQADKDEVRAAAGLLPVAALHEGILTSDPCHTMCKASGEVVAVFGVAPQPEPLLGGVWMLASPGLEDLQRPFLRKCRDWVDELNARYPILFNYVDARNTLHIKWLRWCGFTFINLHEAYGFERKPFYEFVRIKRCV